MAIERVAKESAALRDEADGQARDTEVREKGESFAQRRRTE